jgi:hypothetical protein
LRLVVALVSFVVALASPAVANPTLAPMGTAPLRPGELASEHAVLRWMNAYRFRHDVGHVPDAMKALSALGTFKDPGACGAYVGFFAGVLGSNPSKFNEIVTRSLAMPEEDHWVIVQAIAYSGLPDWKERLRRIAPRIPTRQVMIDKYLDGSLKTLGQMEFDKKFTLMDRVHGFFDVKKFVPGGEPSRFAETYDASTTVLDTLWGYYFATGDTRPIMRIVGILPWARDRNNAEKLTIGATAKLTLASNAARDPTLLAILRNECNNHQPKEVSEVLKDVVDAADTAQTERIRRESLADIDEIKRKGSLSRRETLWWGQAGQLALAGVCVVEAALGNLAFGIPCVIGGGLSAAALTYYGNTQQ